jgi:molybdate transport system substrate-binding protein
MKRTTVVAALGVALSSALVVAGCGSSSSAKSSGAKSSTPTSAQLSGSITVFAASSLTEAFTKLGTDFERGHPGSSVKFSFGASSALETQIEQGAPADVFAAADPATGQELAAAGKVAGSPTTFARNRLAIAVEPGNPKHITSLADLAKPGVVLVLCADAVPCGKFAAEALAKAHVTVTPASKEENVKAVLSKVTLGEADAGIVYVTDVKSAGTKVTGVTIPDSQNVIAKYPIGIVKGTGNRAVADAFRAYVTSTPGLRTLRSFGFLPP